MAQTRKIRITAGNVKMDADLNASPTAALIWNALPIEASGQTWGDEIYFAIPVRTDQEPDAKAVVDLGAIAYWPPGNAFCIFFGPTPSSRNKNEIRPYSPVTVVGKVLGDPTLFKQVRSGAKVRLEQAQ